MALVHSIGIDERRLKMLYKPKGLTFNLTRTNEQNRAETKTKIKAISIEMPSKINSVEFRVWKKSLAIESRITTVY